MHYSTDVYMGGDACSSKQEAETFPSEPEPVVSCSPCMPTARSFRF